MGSMQSCDSFLDTMPDKRTEINTPTKVRDILLSAYPTLHPTIMFEFMSDNYADNGDMYSSPMNGKESVMSDVIAPSWVTIAALPPSSQRYEYEGVSTAVSPTHDAASASNVRRMDESEEKDPSVFSPRLLKS